MNEEQEENVSGFTRDIKNSLRQKDFGSATILVHDLKEYIMEMRREVEQYCIMKKKRKSYLKQQ